MTDEQLDEPPTDAALDREIEKLVTPALIEGAAQ